MACEFVGMLQYKRMSMWAIIKNCASDRKKSKLFRTWIVIKHGNEFGICKIFCDGTSIWIYQQETNEVTINSVEDSQNEILNISKFISEANSKFRPKLIREEKGDYIIDLIPKTKSEFSKVRLKTNIKTNRISSIEVNYRSSKSYTYNITTYKTKVPLKESDFVFNKKNYPTANVVDLR